MQNQTNQRCVSSKKLRSMFGSLADEISNKNLLFLLHSSKLTANFALSNYHGCQSTSAGSVKLDIIYRAIFIALHNAIRLLYPHMTLPFRGNNCDSLTTGYDSRLSILSVSNSIY